MYSAYYLQMKMTVFDNLESLKSMYIVVYHSHFISVSVNCFLFILERNSRKDSRPVGTCSAAKAFTSYNVNICISLSYSRKRSLSKLKLLNIVEYLNKRKYFRIFCLNFLSVIRICNYQLIAAYWIVN